MGQLDEAVAEVKARLAAIDGELEAIGQGIDPLDAKAATAAIVRKSKLTQERAALVLRLPALEKALAEAERSAALERVTAISAELAVLAAEGEAEAVRFAEALERLSRLVEDSKQRQQRYAELSDEARYLATLHDFDSLSVPGLEMPNKALAEALARQTAHAVTVSVHTTWAYKLSQLKQQRAKERDKAQPDRPTIVYGEGHLSDSEMLQRYEEERQKRLGLDKLWTHDQSPRLRQGSYMQELLHPKG